MANDFSQGKVWKNIIAQAIPLTLAQLVQLLYNLVDRIYIGHLPGADNIALTGVGLAFPLITLIAAFTNLFGTGGAPLFAIARGAREEEKAEQILGNVCALLLYSSVLIFLFCYSLRRPILRQPKCRSETSRPLRRSTCSRARRQQRPQSPPLKPPTPSRLLHDSEAFTFLGGSRQWLISQQLQ